MEILNTKSYKKIEGLLELLTNVKEIKNNKEEKLFRYKKYDLYMDLDDSLKKDFEKQEEIKVYSLYFSLYQNKLEELKDKLIECSKKFNDRNWLSSYLKQLAIRLQEKIDAKGANINILIRLTILN